MAEEEAAKRAAAARTMSRRQRLRAATAPGGANAKLSLGKQTVVFLIFIWVVIPIFVFTLAWIFGAILGRIENWPAKARAQTALVSLARGAGRGPCARARRPGAPARGAPGARTARTRALGGRPARRAPHARPPFRASAACSRGPHTRLC
jgi:hypothetical protein